MSHRIGIDVGGTFTDLAVLDTVTGALTVTKAPSTPSNPTEGVTAVIAKAQLTDGAVASLIHGTTIATNALLERKKATPGLITTAGFRDVVFIQRMNRKHHYDLDWDKPQPFVERRHCLEVVERTNYKGEVLVPLDEEGARATAAALKRDGIKDVAVSFLFSYINPANERRMAEILAEVHPDATVSLSHAVYPRWREYDRTSTVLADAFLKSLVGEYLENLADGLAAVGQARDFLVMKSNGGVEHYQAATGKPIDLLVSGPVGGVLSSIFFGRLTGRENLISMDMGGTSFDVSLIVAGRTSQTTEFEIEWGLPVYTPMVDVKTIGAGGGSIAWIDKGGLLRTGPQSAGAYPGPACYGRGGADATVTDANLALGRLNPDFFLGGELTLDLSATRAALERLGGQLSMTVEETASAIVELVDFNMVNAIRLVSIDRGLDPRDFALVSFGGAGSLHAGALADILGILDVLVPIHQGVFSAFGLITADMRVDESVTVSFRSDLLDLERLNDVLDGLRTQALARLQHEGYRGQVVVEPTVEMRYLGQNYSTDIAVPVVGRDLTESDITEIYARFHAEHRRLYGYDITEEIIELVNITVTAIGPTEKPRLAKLERTGKLEPKAERDVYFRSAGGWLPTTIYDRSTLPVGASFDGPAVIEEAMSTTLVHPGHTCEVDEYGNLILHTAAARLQ